MNWMALITAVLLATTTAGPQQKTDTAETKPPDSPLVRAAKAAGGPIKKMPKKVITNADVKKSRGKLVILPERKPAPGTATATAPAAPAKGLIERHQEQLKAEDAAAQRVTKAEKKVTELEKELRRLEEAYYAENDPTYRDTTITTRFNQTKRQLDEARKTLADARDAQEKLEKVSP